MISVVIPICYFTIVVLCQVVRKRLSRFREWQWAPMKFFLMIPKIDLSRFSFQYSFGLIVHEKLEKFQNIWIGIFSKNLQQLEKLGDREAIINTVNSRNVFYVKKLFNEINAEIEKLSGDTHFATELGRMNCNFFWFVQNPWEYLESMNYCFKSPPPKFQPQIPSIIAFLLNNWM
jgi:hypothetical protein